jgi:hypothetical protein
VLGPSVVLWTLNICDKVMGHLCAFRAATGRGA